MNAQIGNNCLVSELTPKVLVFCALLCEARPLIKAWCLERLPSSEHPFAIYVGGDRAIVITGIGKINMAGAMGYVLALFGNPKAPVLINLGIAGHRSASIGELCLGHKIIDKETGRCFYPQLPFTVPCATYSVITHAMPETSYTDDCLCEMEAAGFYELAVKFSSSELIQVVKIVSDNPQSSLAGISENRVEDWITSQLAVIDELVAQLISLWQLNQAAAMPLYQELLGQFHFSVTNALRLKNLLQRWWLLRGDDSLAWEGGNIRNAKELISWIENQLDRTEFYL